MKAFWVKRKWFVIAATALLLALCLLLLSRPPQPGGTYDNLIKNGGFEQTSNGLPASWYTEAWFSQSSYTSYGVDAGVNGLSGHIQNRVANDARFAQKVSVSPNTLYCLRGLIKANAQNGLGANLSIDGIYVFSKSVYDTGDGWQEVALYGRTGANQTSVTVFARLGGYSGEATGEAWFDDITLNRVDSVPSGYRENSWYKEPAAPAAKNASSTGAGTLIAVAAAYIALFFLLVFWTKKEKAKQTAQPEKNCFSLTAFFAVLLIGLAVRLFIAYRVPGYDVDIGCFRGWSDSLAELGPVRFYQEAGFCDYPPGYLWVLWGLGGLGRLFDTGATEMMVKQPPIMADMILCVLLYREARKRDLSSSGAVTLCSLYAFNPLVIVTGAAWGQADSVMLLLLFLTVVYAVRGKWSAALPVYVASVLVKPQALMFGPLGLAALIRHLVTGSRDPEQRKKIWLDCLIGAGLSLLAALALAGPFVWRQEKPVSWLIDLYSGTMSQYGYVTVNACNLYFLMEKNWVGSQALLFTDHGEVLPAIAAYCAAVLPLLAAAGLHAKKWMESRTGRVRLYLIGGLSLALAFTLGALAALGQLSYAALGTAMIVYMTALFAALYLLGNGAGDLPLLGAAMLLALFNTGTMMHERYLFPAVGLLLLSYAGKKDKRILYLALLVSLAGFLNVGCALDRNIRISGAAGHLHAPASGISSDMTALEMISAVLNCLSGAFALYLSAVLCARDAVLLPFRAAVSSGNDVESDGSPAKRRVHPLPVSRPLPRMTGKDWAVMGVVTVLYGVLALTNLGALKSPQTAWVSRQEDEAAVIDLGEEKSFYMLYFPGIHWRSDYESAEFDVETSLDGVNWESGYLGSVKSGDTFDCFHWKYVSISAANSEVGSELHGRYVRIVSQFPELTLFEVLFRDAETGETLPIAGSSDTVLLRDADTGGLLGDQSAAEPMNNPTLAFLTDEQDAMEGGEPGWYNSTYFDEIYHARTAYEHLHGLPVYETTHPPLGKLLMSAAIAVFGMTPFGWRFAGALAGILMLPGMYLLGKLLIRRKWGGFAAMALMALDLMHFTQTRIATIDSFVVLFIIWSVYFMLRWFFLDDPDIPLKKSLIPLALSGLCMGLAIASKWTGCYAGAGLAVLFFYGIFRRWRVAAEMRKQEAEKKTSGKKKASQKEKEKAAISSPWQDRRVKKLLITVGSCLIFFVAVPVLIYYCSYIPYFAPNGGVTVQRIIDAAEGMLSYHSTPGLGMDHYFYSPWYQWPVIAKPMWYYSGSYEPDGYASTIMALGNPAVWWTGLLGLLGALALFIRRHYDEKNHTLSLCAASDDPRYALLLICFAAQYLPWVPVPRGTYIYHYFPSVPFIILSLLLCLDTVSERYEKAVKIAVYLLIAVAAALFAAFFPYASGLTVSERWLDAMKWFPRWLWY